jgi:uncharacterized protein YndB with AHSA1/START domain
MMKKARIQAQLTVNSLPQKLFHALTDTAELTQWFCEHAEIALEARRYDFWGRFTPEAPERNRGYHPLLTFGPTQRLVFGWQLYEVETIVDIRVEDKGGGTHVTLLHEGFLFVSQAKRA